MKSGIFLFILAFSLLLTACTAEKSDTPADTTQEIVSAPAELVIASGGVCEYTVVRAEMANDSVTKAAIKLCTAIEAASGARPAITTDWKDNPILEKEIIVGTTTREETQAHAIDYTAIGKEGYIINTDGEAVYIVGGSDESTVEAVEYFIGEFVKGGEIQLDGDYSYSVTVSCDIQSLTINGVPIGEYVILRPDSSSRYRKSAEALADAIWEKAGVICEVVTDAGEHEHLIVMSADKPDKSGIHLVTCENGTLTFESSAESGLTACVDRFIGQYLRDAYGSYNISDGFVFAAVGDYISISDPRN